MSQPPVSIDSPQGEAEDTPTVFIGSPPGEAVDSPTQKWKTHVHYTETHTSTSSFRGPLPPVSYLREIEDIEPGLASRVVALAEGEAEHRHAMDNRHMDAVERQVDGQFRATARGTYVGAGVIALALIATVILAAIGYPIAATLLGSLDLVTLAAIFVRQGGAKRVDMVRSMRADSSDEDGSYAQDGAVNQLEE